MKPNVLALALLFGLSGPTLGQSNSDRGFTHGESKRCESMTGSAKEQCDKQEATKTDGGAQAAPATGSGAAAALTGTPPAATPLAGEPAGGALAKGLVSMPVCLRRRLSTASFIA